MATEVQFVDGSVRSASVRGFDTETDLAVLELDRDAGFRPLSWDIRTLRAGELLLLVSNPLALARSTSLGIVSSANRRLARPGLLPLEGAVQLDAFVAPGSSGGAVVSMRGDLVGIVLARNIEHVGLAFAIPALTADWVTREIILRGLVRRRVLGVRLRAISRDVAGLARQMQHVRIEHVEKGSVAQRAGLRTGDIIFGLDDQPVSGIHSVQRVLGGDRANVRFDVERDRRTVTINLTLTAPPL